MTPRSIFDEAKRSLSYSFERNTSLCAPFLSIVPVSGAAVSYLGSTAVGSTAVQSTICASDDIAAHLDEVQFDLGEGPCWEALTANTPALHSDIRAEEQSVWPLFADAIRGDGVGAVFAFPLIVSSLEIGAVDLYSLQPRPLTPQQVADASELAKIASWQVLRRVLADNGDAALGVQDYSRREVHQATGMVIAQLEISADDATLLLRAHAFSSGRSVREIASDIVARTLSFAPDRPASAAPDAR